jgi:hypothetical protein
MEPANVNVFNFEKVKNSDERNKKDQERLNFSLL